MNVCVYGASSNRIGADYIEKTEELGKVLAQAGHGLVYGAGGAGLMGAIARGFYAQRGYIVGVVPKFLQVDGCIFEHCDELIYTDTMRQRKQIMDDRCDAFVVTPGGVGTYEEFFEVYTTKQLGRHHKPIILYNINGYFEPVLQMLQATVDKNFMRERSLRLIAVADTPDEVLRLLGQTDEVVDIHETKFI